MKKYTTLLALVPLAFTGCATVISGSDQSVNIKAVNRATGQIVPGAMCTVKGANMSYPVPGNPGIISVTRKSGVLSVVCKKNGYHESTHAVTSSLNGWTIVNILFWPGFIVDALTGSMQKYPASVTIPMQPRK